MSMHIRSIQDLCTMRHVPSRVSGSRVKCNVWEFYGTQQAMTEVRQYALLPLMRRVHTFSGMLALGNWLSSHGPR